MKMKFPEQNLPRWQKILLVLYVLSEAKKKPLKFEDIVVAAYKRFPETFHLRGYKEYPDSGDLIHKPLYDMRPRGLLTANQKMFSLTDKGILAAKQLNKVIKGGGEAHFKPSREIGKEIERILSTDAFVFFTEKKTDKILDTDFLQYLGVSVHTSKNGFRNRLDTVKYAVESAGSFYPTRTCKSLSEYHKFMLKQFGGLVKEMSEQKERNV